MTDSIAKDAFILFLELITCQIQLEIQEHKKSS